MSDLSVYSHFIARDKHGNRIVNPVMQSPAMSKKPKQKEEYIEPYIGEIPSIIGLVLMLVKLNVRDHPNSKECFVFARKDNAQHISEKYGKSFKRFLGVVTHEPYPRPKPKASYNYWEAVYDDYDTAEEALSVEDFIVQQELSGKSKLDIQEEEEIEYNPYSDQPISDEEDDTTEQIKVEDPDKITPGNFNEKIKIIIAERLTEKEAKFFELWRRGSTRAVLKNEVFITESMIYYLQKSIFKKIGAEYGAKSMPEFSNTITNLGIAYQAYLCDRERKKIMSGAAIAKDSALLRDITDKEKEVIMLMRMKLTASSIAYKLNISNSAVAGFRKRIIGKIGLSLFTRLVKKQVNFEVDLIKVPSLVERRGVTEEQLNVFREGIKFDTNQDLNDTEEEKPELIEKVDEIEEQGDRDSIHIEALLSVFQDEHEQDGDLEEVFHKKESTPVYAVNNDSSLVVNVDRNPELTGINVYTNPVEVDSSADEEDYKIMSSIMAAPLPPSFKEFISLYKNSRDATKAEEQFNKLTEADKITLLAHVPSYLKSVSNPAYIKSPLAYITGRSWLKKV